MRQTQFEKPSETLSGTANQRQREWSPGMDSTTCSTTTTSQYDKKLILDGRTVGDTELSTSILDRLHQNYHGSDKIFAAAKDVWIPLMHRNLSAAVK